MASGPGSGPPRGLCERGRDALTAPAARRTMAHAERTFIAIKPDGVQRGLMGEIIKRFEQKGFRLVAMKFLQVTRPAPLPPRRRGRGWFSFPAAPIRVSFPSRSPPWLISDPRIPHCFGPPTPTPQPRAPRARLTLPRGPGGQTPLEG